MPRSNRRESGSAFTVALLVLFVLTIAGLALTLMTQTELRIGSNERTTTRSFYAADSGIGVATAREIVPGPETTTHFFLLNTTAQDSSTGTTSALTTFSDSVTITPLILLGTQYCSLCMLNQNNNNEFVAAAYVVNSTAKRTGVDGSTTEAFSQKLVGTTIVMQPQKKDNGAGSATAAQIPVVM